jgi:hypothetical protein
MSFPAHERRMLLAQHGIGPTVIARIEPAGIHSLDALQTAGVRLVVEGVCDRLGKVTWSNRSKALARALELLAQSSRLGALRREAYPDPALSPLQLARPATSADSSLRRACGHP